MIKQDCLRRFLFEALGVRGEWVHLQSSWQAAKQHQNLPPMLETQLGQALAAVTLLVAPLKFTGSMILQIQGNGGLRTLVAQATHDKKIRGLIRADAQQCSGSLAQLAGEGQLILTLKSGDAPSYQGVVNLEGENLSQTLETYFRQSEQLKTRLWLFANATTAVGLLLQELPTQTHNQTDWQHIEALANTITEAELLNLGIEEMLYRLFNQEHIRIFEPEPVEFVCHCSYEKISQTLYAMGAKELNSILAEQKTIDVDCEFCAAHYQFTQQNIAELFE